MQENAAPPVHWLWGSLTGIVEELIEAVKLPRTVDWIVMLLFEMAVT